MSQRGETNQWLYHAGLLLAQTPQGQDDIEHRAQQAAFERAAALMLERGLVSLLRELDDMRAWGVAHWREQLAGEDIAQAELSQIKSLLTDGDSWLSRFMSCLDAIDGRPSGPVAVTSSASMIATSRRTQRDTVDDAAGALKALAGALRSTNEEW
ncbi:DUF6586 family protein [Larsenimonas salina]|uniref:DUF6586 family protein n=1 Tax=Larsenimonas salina TaxID=1295565 RepID=UPI002073A1D4|nr:DUF6586 family protein [Larsenimonas salina]MCM5703591.1 hypothetical protein [Larsenimonas salina]